MSLKPHYGRCYHDGEHNQCIVYKKCESPKNFSRFVDKVIETCPVKINSRHFLVDPNNPIKVLEKKGLMNISNSAVRRDDCSSDVKLNFYSQESRCGNPVKVFTSNHHFKHGKLIYSSVHEFLPELHSKREKSIEWEKKRQISLSDGELSYKSETCYNRSTRKKLRDVFQDKEKEKIIRRYGTEARRRRLHSRSLSPINVSDVADRERERFLHTLRSKNVRRQASPKIFRCHKVCKCRPSADIERSDCIKSSSELSVCTRKSWAYSSPERIIKKTSRIDKQYRRTRKSSPKLKFKQEFFVIPDHTCSKVPHIERYRSQCDTVRRCVTSPRTKLSTKISSSLIRHEIKHDHITRDSQIPHNKYEHEFIKSSKYNSVVKNSRDKSPLKGILRRKQERSVSRYSPSERIRFCKDTTDETKSYWHSGKAQASGSSRHNHARTHEQDKILHRCNKFERGRRRESPKTTTMGHSDEERTFSANAEGETESDSSSRMSPRTESDNEGAITDESSSDYKTSICSLASNDQNKTSSSARRFEKSSEQHTRGKKQYSKSYREESYKHSETRRDAKQNEPLKYKHDMDLEEFDGSKTGKKRRQINPNKVVHLEDTGKRLSQYYSKGEAILDSEKAFEDEEKVQSKKIRFFSCSPTRPRVCKPCRSCHVVPYREKSLDDYLKRVCIDDYRRNMHVIESMVNNEALTKYREKCACYPIISDQKEMVRSMERRERDFNAISVNRGCSFRDCDACIIERLQGEN